MVEENRDPDDEVCVTYSDSFSSALMQVSSSWDSLSSEEKNLWNSDSVVLNHLSEVVLVQ